MESPSKMEQLKNTGKKAVNNLKNAAGNIGSNMVKLLKNSNTTPELQLSEMEIMKQKREGQVMFFIFLLIGILIFVGLVFVSKTFRVYTTLHRLEIYKSNELSQKSILSISGMKGSNKKLKDFYVASAYKPYVCYYHKYDYCSLEVFRQVLCAGARMVELEIFNDSFSVDVEPVVSSGTSDGEWQLCINSLPFTEVLKVIASTVFNQKYVNELNIDPFIIYLNLKNNRNVVSLEKISKYIYEILGEFLLDIKYSYNSNRNNAKFSDITLDEVERKIIIFCSEGFEGSPLEEVVNYSVASDYTLENNPEQYRILYLRNSDIVEKDEDLEEFNNTTHYKVSKDDLKNYNKCGFSIVAPTNDTNNGFFDGISPFNPEPTKVLESGCQFIMMNYQMIDTNMSNYTYIFKDSSFVEKATALVDHATDSTCSRKFTSIKTKKLEHTNSEVVYTYVTPKDKIENTQ